MEKFNRSYKAVFTVGKREGLSNYIRDKDKVTTITVTSGNYDKNDGYTYGGYTLEFSIDRVAYSTTGNTGNFRFKNLPPEVQALLWLDRYQTDKFVDFELYAGYQTTQPKIFQGQITQCYSYRRGGDTDFITDIEANNFTAFNQMGLINLTLQSGTEFENIIKTIANYSSGELKAGYITKKIPAIRKTTTYRGSALGSIISDYSGFQIYIDNGLINVLDENDVVPSDVTVITANSGLLGSPRRSEYVVELETIFEPGLIVGQAVAVLSDSMSWLNQTYKVVGLTHEGTISPAECGKVTTKVQLYLGTALLNQLQEANYTHEDKTASGEWVYPLSIKGRISSRFGMRKDPITGKDKMHQGIDISTNKVEGYDVLATNDGEILEIGTDHNGYGKFIKILHGKISGVNVVSLYGHLKQYWGSAGDKVTRGQAIAKSGNTGRSSGPHLHFGIQENGSWVNPSKYVKGLQ